MRYPISIIRPVAAWASFEDVPWALRILISAGARLVWNTIWFNWMISIGMMYYTIYGTICGTCARILVYTSVLIVCAFPMITSDQIHSPTLTKLWSLSNKFQVQVRVSFWISIDRLYVWNKEAPTKYSRSIIYIQIKDWKIIFLVRVATKSLP